MPADLSSPALDQEFSHYELNDDLDQTNYGYKVGVYFNRQAVIITRYYSALWCAGQKGDYIGCASFDVNAADGTLTRFARKCWVVNPGITAKDSGLSGNSVAAVVYKGQIYAFYDYINPAEWKERLLYYKTTSDPSRSWGPEGGTRITVAETLAPGFGPGTPSQVITAAVLNDKLHVFYTHNRVAMLYCVVFDGTTWSRGPSLDTRGHFGFNDMDSKSVITGSGKELIAIMGVGNYSGNNVGAMVLFNGSNYYWSDAYCSFSAAGLDGSYVRLAFGTVSPGSQKHVLQVFGEMQSPPVGLFRCEYDLDGGSERLGGFSNWSHVIDIGSTWACRSWCPLPHYVADKDSNLRQYLSIIYRGSVGKICCITYTSDFYAFAAESSINTATDNLHADAWTIIGVIEGVPPFCLNNNEPGTASDCSVEYGESTKESVSTSVTYEAAFTVGVEGKVASCGGGFSFSEGFKNVHEYTKEITRSIKYFWNNRGANADGSKGFMLVQKPTLTVRNYTRYSSDRRISLGAITFTSVVSIDLVEYVYDLERPLAGMKVRPKSSDFKGWYHSTPADVNIYETVNSLSAVAGIGTCTASIEVSSAEKHDNCSTSKIQVEGSFAEMFKASVEFSFSLSCVNSTTLNKNISASITLSDDPHGRARNLVNSMAITPYWLLAKDRSQACWIPDGYKYNSPWCLTWSVASLDPAPADLA